MSHEADSLPDPPDPPEMPSPCANVTFDLRTMLTAGELEKFQSAAAGAHAPSLTEHFLTRVISGQ